MANPPGKLKFNLSAIETPFTIRQAETHLVFGPISRHIPFAYVVFVFAAVSLVGGFFAVGKPIGEYIGSMVDKLIYLVIPVLLLRMSRRQQAIIGWMAIKFALGMGAFMMATVGAGTSFQRGSGDAWPDLFLGLIWIPGIEFIPKITPYQRYVTMARIVLSIPCIYFGIKSGNWHWS
jgi:hypothetical protein